MNSGLASSSKPANTSGTSPHLVVKRGHHGRFRFVMLSEKTTGEVRVDLENIVGDGPRSPALARITKLAEALLARVKTHPAIDEPSSKIGGDPTYVDPPDPRLHMILGEGDHHGQI